MTKTANTLAEIVPRFEKPRADARALKNEASSDPDLAGEKTTFAHLVKNNEGKVTARSEQGVRNDRGVERDAALPQSRADAAKLPMQTGNKLGSASGMRDLPDGGRGLAEEAEQPSLDPGFYGLDNATVDGRVEAVVQTKTADVAKAIVGTDGVEKANQESDSAAVNKAEPTELDDRTRAIFAADRGAEAALLQSVKASTASQKEALSDVTSARQPAATRALTASEALDRSSTNPVALGEPAARVNTNGIEAVNRTTSRGESRVPPTQFQAMSQSDEVNSRPPLATDPERVEAAAVAKSDDGRSGSGDRAATMVATAAWADAAAVRRMADATQALRRGPDKTATAIERKGGAADANPVTIERVTMNAAVERPEQTARLAFETATVQRSLGGREQLLVAEDGMEMMPSDMQIKGAQADGMRPATLNPVSILPANGGTTVANLYGQLVQSVASTDGLPRSGAEFKLLAAQSGVGASPEPLKVLQLQLQPKELGEVMVRLAMRGDKLELRVQTARQATAELLMSDQRVLVEALQQKNFDVDSVTIQLMDPERTAGGQSGLPNGAQGKAGQGESFEAATEGQTSRENDGSGGRDGNGDGDRPETSQDGQLVDALGRRRGIYL